jgi:hypothetical protein
MSRRRSLRWWPPDALRVPFPLLRGLTQSGALPDGCRVDGLDFADDTFGSIGVSWPDDGTVSREGVELAMLTWWHRGRPPALAAVLPFRRAAP